MKARPPGRPQAALLFSAPQISHKAELYLGGLLPIGPSFGWDLCFFAAAVWSRPSGAGGLGDRPGPGAASLPVARPVRRPALLRHEKGFAPLKIGAAIDPLLVKPFPARERGHSS
jgi:hypothetical protein